MSRTIASQITQKTYQDAYTRAHEERALAIKNGWNWLFSRG